MERGLSFGSRGPQSDFARLCWRVRIQNNNHQRHATTQGVSHAAVKHPARFRGLRAPHALYCAHQPNSAVKPTPTSSACGCPPCFALRRGLPRALGREIIGVPHDRSPTCCKCALAASVAILISHQIRMTLGSVPLSARSARLALSQSLVVAAQTAAGRFPSAPPAWLAPWKETQHQQYASSNPVAALPRPNSSFKPKPLRGSA